MQIRITEFIGGNIALSFILGAIECLWPVCKNLISYSGRPVENLDPNTGDHKWEISWFPFSSKQISGQYLIQFIIR